MLNLYTNINCGDKYQLDLSINIHKLNEIFSFKNGKIFILYRYVYCFKFAILNLIILQEILKITN